MFVSGDKVKVRASKKDLVYISVWTGDNNGVKDGDILTVDRQYDDGEWNDPKLNGDTYIVDGWVSSRYGCASCCNW